MKFLTKIAGASALAMASVGAFAQSTNPIVVLLESVDLTAVAAAIAVLALLVVGIAMGFKSPDVAKRIIRKV